jgi:hypothetical protein
VHDHTVDEVGLLGAAVHAGGVVGFDVRATREMKGHVVNREGRDGVEQLDDPLVRQPVGDVEQAQAAAGPQRRKLLASGKIAARLDDLQARPIEPVLLDEDVCHDGTGRHEEIACPVGGEVETASQRRPTRRTCSPGMLVHDGDGERTVVSTPQRADSGPGVEAVDDDDVRRR